MVFRVVVLMVSFISANAHAFMNIPRSRNLKQCPHIGPDGLPILKLVNGCLITQDRINFIPGGCPNLPCIGTGCIIKFMPGSILPDVGRETCSPGNYPGLAKIKNVCGDPTNAIFILPGIGAHFKKDKPQVTWQAGTVVHVQVKYYLNHAGNYQFRLCLDGADNWDNDDCFKRLPLQFADKTGVTTDQNGGEWKWLGGDFMPVGIMVQSVADGLYMDDYLIIPDDIECESCTLNWRWDAALEQSVFSNCAEVKIQRDSLPPSFNLVASSGLCLDIPGPGNYEDGQPLWVWECMGTTNQNFIFADGSWRIVPADASELCIDAGNMEVGTQLMLWDCNGYDQQTFGYDSSSGTIYLANSVSDASLCLQAEGDWNSARLLIAQCDDNDETQQWGFSSFSSRLNVARNHTVSPRLV